MRPAASPLSHQEKNAIQRFGLPVAMDGSTAPLTSHGGATIGAFPALGFFYQGDIAELIIYDFALSCPERNAVNADLASRYGLPFNAEPCGADLQVTIADAFDPVAAGTDATFVAFDPNAPEGELGFFVFSPETSPATLPEGNLLTVSFRVLDGSVGTADVAFSPALPPQGADSRGVRFGFDEVADGTVSIAP